MSNTRIQFIQVHSTAFKCFLQKRKQINRAASFIRWMVQKETKRTTAPLNACRFTYNQLTTI